MRIAVRVKPFARQARVEKSSEGLTVWVDAPAAEGKANERVREICAEHFSVAKSRVQVTRGLKSRHKIITIIE